MPITTSMSRFARLVVVALTMTAFAAVPAMAQAAPGHGNRCGKGHTKHSRAIGKACKKHGNGNAKRRDEVAPTAPTTVPAEVVKACKDEQTADETAFNAKYANAAGREALGRCIRINAGLNGDTPPPAPPVQTDFAAAAKACAAEKAADEAAFVAKYGDENGREAFGHCVRENAKPVTQDQSGGDQGDNATGDDGTPSDAPAGDGSGDTSATDGSGDGSGDETQKSADGLDSLFF